MLVVAPADPLTQLTLNKRLYGVGEIVFFRSVTLDRFTLRPPDKSLRLQHSLLDAQGKAVLSLANATGAGGIASGEFALTKELAEGDYTLRVADEAGAPAARPLHIVRDVPAALYFVARATGRAIRWWPPTRPPFRGRTRSWPTRR